MAYNTVLDVSPKHPDALRLLGILSHQTGKTQVAVELIRKAIAVKRGFIDAYNNLGCVLKDQGRLEEAEEAYRKAITLKPELADANNNLGAVLNDQGRADERAETSRHLGYSITLWRIPSPAASCDVVSPPDRMACSQ